MRLIKAAAYALLGYVLYELVVGIVEGEPAGDAGGPMRIPRSGQGQPEQRGAAKGRRDLNRALNENPGRMSGPARGMKAEAHESDGGSTNRAVGRGVAH